MFQIEHIIKLFEKRSSMQVVKDAFKELHSKKKSSRFFRIILLAIVIILSICVKMRSDTFEVVMEIIEFCNDLLLTLFGIFFTGYAFFQALINREMLKRMLETKENDKTHIQISNEYFVNIMLLDLVFIILGSILLLLGKIVPQNIYYLLPVYMRSILVIVVITVYLFYQLLLLIEMKSFVFNIFQLFNISAGTQAIDILNEEESKRKKTERKQSSNQIKKNKNSSKRKKR